MGIKRLIVLLHLEASIVALVTSIIQTHRIIKTISRFNTPALLILSGGLIAAVFGTFSILKIVKKGAQQIEENNKMLRGSK